MPVMKVMKKARVRANSGTMKKKMWKLPKTVRSTLQTLNFELHHLLFPILVPEGSILVVNDPAGRKFAKLVKLNRVRVKISWLVVSMRSLLQFLILSTSLNVMENQANTILFLMLST